MVNTCTLAAIAIPSAGILGIATAVAVLAFIAEMLHTRKIQRVRHLAFGAHPPRSWVRGIPIARSLALGLTVFGLLTLLTIDGRPAEVNKKRPPDRHLLLVLDVSPSMYLADAGPTGKQTRQDRAADVMQSLLDRLDMTRTKVTIVGFYSDARPVVVDTGDMAVVNNIIRDLPLAQAFKEGQTNMYSGVKAAARVAGTWKPGSATLVVISDGDTLPDTDSPRMPSSITDTLVIGIGNPYRGTSIAGRTSRQDGTQLKRLASRFKGQYHDGNTRHLPSTVLSSLSMLSLKEDQSVPLRTVALTCIATGSAVLAAIPVALAFVAFPRRIPNPRRTDSRGSRDLQEHSVRPQAVAGGVN